MNLPDKAQAALNKVVARFQSGDLSPIVEIARFEADVPSARWSFSNQILAFVQTGDLDCRGYRQWQQAGRHVKKGEHAAYILAPCTFTVKDEDNGEERTVLKGFRGVAVFGASQTEGEPLPEFAPKELPPLADVAADFGISVEYTPLPGRLGDCSTDGTEIRLGTADNAVFFHELGHAAHARINGELNGGQHSDQETIAEFCSAVLMELYGEDRTGNAWSYISGYNKDPLLAVVQAMGTVEQILGLLTKGE